MKPLLHKLAYSVIALRLRLRLMEANEVANSHVASQFAKFADGNSVGKRGAEQTSDACSHDPGDRDLFLFKNFDYAQVSKPAGEPATQGQHHAGRVICVRLPVPAQRFAR